jgi:hypothetical protein
MLGRRRFGQTPTALASLDDLLRMKEAAGRPKDLEDLRVRPGSCYGLMEAT